MTGDGNDLPGLDELRARYREITPPPGLAERIVGHAPPTIRKRPRVWVPAVAVAAVAAAVVGVALLWPASEPTVPRPSLFPAALSVPTVPGQVPALPLVSMPSLADVSSVPLHLTTPAAESASAPNDRDTQSAVPIIIPDSSPEDSVHESTTPLHVLS